MKPTADVVAHPAERHRPQRHEYHLARLGRSRSRVLAQQKQQLAWTRKLRRIAKAPPSLVKGRRKLFHAFVKRSRRGNLAPAAVIAEGSKTFRDRFGRRFNPAAILLPRPRNLLEDVDEAGPAPLRLGRMVGAAV